jgi:predicted RNase H-like nuclease (RuvC/YqgF family)
VLASVALLTFIAAVEVAGLFALSVGVLGLGSIIFAALRYNRDDTTAIVNQQSTLLGNMKTLNDELRNTADSIKTERDALRVEVDRLTGQVEALRSELREMRQHIGGKVTSIERKLDNGGTGSE